MTRRTLPSRLAASLPLLLLLLDCGAAAAAPGSVAEEAFRAASGWTVQVRSSVHRPFIEDQPGSWLGAGIVVDAARGWVLTNAHVAGYSYGQLLIGFQDGEPVPARRLYVDPHLDLAVLAYDPRRVTARVGEPTLECAGMPAAGHPVGAYGHPWGFRYTATRGITSAVTTRLGPTMLQTDAPINEGNSGGPLISLETGRIVGVNAAKIKDAAVEGLSFAIPMPYACTILALLQQGRDPSPPQDRVDFARDANDEQTLIVAASRLPEGSLDLRPGDRLLAVGEPRRVVTTESDLVDALRGRLDAVRLELLRDGKPVTVTGRWPAAAPIVERRGLWVSGAIFAGADQTTGGLVTGTPALMVHHVSPGSEAESAGLETFDLLTSVDGRAVDSLATLGRLAVDAGRTGRSLRLLLLRLTGEDDARLFRYELRELPVSGIEEVGP